MSYSNPDFGSETSLFVTKVYEHMVIGVTAMLPLFAVVYLFLFQSLAQRFEDHFFHEVAISIAIAQSGFIAFVTWRCYVSSGEPLLRWFALAFIGFAVVYAPHGVFTSLANTHIWLFLLYGPVSRLVMAYCLLAGVLAYGKSPDATFERTRLGRWLPWLLTFVLIDLSVAAIALLWPASPFVTNIAGWGAEMFGLPDLAKPTLFFRLAAESGAIVLSLAGIVLILTRRTRPPLMLLTAIALAYSAQASLAFLFAKTWEHMWWLAHLISAAGFTLLSYGVVRAYHTTRAFSLVFSQEEVMRKLATAKSDAESLAARLELANKELEVQATTDPLTGLSNRRHFLARAEIEVARASRGQTSFSVLALDLDHFKNINDTHGHAAGDAVLKCFAEMTKAQLRPPDLIGRVGGEEFLVLLPGLKSEIAIEVAERIRLKVQDKAMRVGQIEITISVSIGISQFPNDGDSLKSVCDAADQRLYRAKNAGRNRSVGSESLTTR